PRMSTPAVVIQCPPLPPHKSLPAPGAAPLIADQHHRTPAALLHRRINFRFIHSGDEVPGGVLNAPEGSQNRAAPVVDAPYDPLLPQSSHYHRIFGLFKRKFQVQRRIPSESEFIQKNGFVPL